MDIWAPKKKYSSEINAENNTSLKNSFRLFQAMTLGDTTYVTNEISFISMGGCRYKPKIFEILK